MDATYTKNEGPLCIDSFEVGLPVLEKVRNSAEYMTSWQSKWNIMWLRPKHPTILNTNLLGSSKFDHNDKSTGPFVFEYEKKFDSKNKNFILQIPSETDVEIPPFCSVDQFMKYAQSPMRSEEIGGEPIKDIDGVKKLIQAQLETGRKPLYVNSFPSSAEVNDPLNNFSNPLQQIPNLSTKIVSSIVQIGPVGIICPIHTEDHDLPSINISHVGCKAWILIEPGCKTRFLKKVGKCVYGKDPPHSAKDCFFRTRNISVTLEQLDEWGIQYTLVFQEPGDIMITFPGLLHGTYTMTFCINSSMNFLTLSREDAQHIKNEFKKCRCSMTKEEKRSKSKYALKHGLWIPEIPENVEKVVWDWMRNFGILGDLHRMSPQPIQVSLVETTNQAITENTCCEADIKMNFPQLQIDINSTLEDLSEYTTVQLLEPQLPVIPDYSSEFEKFYASEISDLVTISPEDLQWLKTGTIAQNNFPSFTHLNNNYQNEQPSIWIESSNSFSFWNENFSDNDDLQSITSSPTGSEKCHSKKSSKSFKCHICNQTLSTKAHLQRHQYLRHSTENISTTCPICERVFKNVLTLQRHLQEPRKTTTSRKYNYCRGKKSDLGPKQQRIRCEICRELLQTRSSYNRHFKNKHINMQSLIQLMPNAHTSTIDCISLERYLSGTA